MLYLVATPIGNLQDISFRALEILKACDYILCEDTRHSEKLLSHYAIKKKAKSYHKFNEAKNENALVADLKQGKTVGLISDAGTPGICDPGARLVARCVQEGIPVSTVPGPCAFIAALTCSGLDTSRFQFLGFLPKKENELKKTLIEILEYRGTSLCYESPNRLINVVEKIDSMDPERLLVIAKELTKKFETFVRGTPEALLAVLKQNPPKGEFVLIIASNENYQTNNWSTLSLEEHVSLVEKAYHLTRTEAIKLVATLRGVPKREIYQKIQI